MVLEEEMLEELKSINLKMGLLEALHKEMREVKVRINDMSK